MAVSGSCHCGKVRIKAPAAPGWVASCNCSICRRTGWLVAYYPDDGGVKIKGETDTYVHGDRMISFHRCPVCGCGTHWEPTGESFGRIGINARLLDHFEWRDGPNGPAPYLDGHELEVRFRDNAGA